MKHPSILLVTLLEVNTKSDEFFFNFWNLVTVKHFFVTIFEKQIPALAEIWKPLNNQGRKEILSV